MKIYLSFIALLMVTLCFLSCGGKSSNGKDASTVDTSSDIVADTNSISSASIYHLLQGKWQRVDDSTNYLCFEKNHRKEIAAGMDVWDDEVYILSDGCRNEMDSLAGYEKSANRYISCKASDLCWYIDHVTADSLTLIYMGRGNALEYVRVK